MAVFDTAERRVVVRIVYDGLEYAGKTTNLQQLCVELQTRRGELETPVEIQGRTAYFDWLTIEGGFVGQFPLVCQLVTVPGQAAREPRRLHLLRSADVVVFVVESTPEGVERARPRLSAMRSFLAERGGAAPPLLLQANHQDRAGAIAPADVAAALGVGGDVPVIGARAHEGVGVRETMVMAVRAAVVEVRRRVMAEGIEVLAGSAEHSDALLEALLDPDLPQTLVGSSPEPSAATRRPTIPAPAPAPAPAPDGGSVTATMVASTRAPMRRSVTRSFASPVAAAAAPAVADEPASDVQAREPLAREVDPPLPSPEVPSAFVWPVVTGRDLLRQVAFGEIRRRDDLGTSDAILFEAGEHFLKTSPRRRFVGADEARAALVRLARKKALLGELLPERTVLALREAPDGSFWLWTVTPWQTTLRSLMSRAAARDDARELGAALAWFARAAAHAAWMASRKQILLDVRPESFSLVRGELAYLDDEIGAGTALPALADALLQRFDEHAAFPAALEEYAGAITAAFSARLSRADAEAIGLAASIQGATPRSAAGRAAIARLSSAIAEIV